MLIVVSLLIFTSIFSQNSHPSSHMTPFVDLMQQPDDITCGPTSVAMLLRYYKKYANLDDIKKITKTVWFHYKDRDYGMTSPEMVRNSLDYFGCQAKLGLGSLSRLKNEISKNNPCIVLVRSGEYNWHYVVVVGYGDGMVFYANPTNAEIVGISESEFMAAWSWDSDLYGRKCSYFVAFWLRSIEIYPNSYVYVEHI